MATIIQNTHVTSITVAFNPDPFRLAKQVAALHGQVAEMFIVDNGSVPSVKSILARPEITALIGADAAVSVLVQQENRGVAGAFNAGIEAAKVEGAQFVLLLDQDSVPGNGMVKELCAGFRQAGTGVTPNAVAAVGPRIVDGRDAYEFPFISFGWFRHRHNRCPGGQNKLIACDFLISSGALISLAAFDKVGPFDDALFIDGVDFEWCCRARANAFSLFGVCGAELNHQLGDHRRVFLHRFNLIVHSPSRVYYQTRNRLLLYRRGYMPLKWKLKDVLRMAAKFLATMLFVSPRLQYLRMTMLGIYDGLANRGGQLRNDR